MTNSIKHGLDFDGAEIVPTAERGSLSVLFQTDKGREEIHFQTAKVEVLRRLYQACISAANVLQYKVN